MSLPYEILSLIAMFLGSIATAAAVIIALFGSKIRRRFFKPQLELIIPKHFPVDCYKKYDSGSNSMYLDICATLINKNEYCAEHTKVICNGVYKREANNGKYYHSPQKFRQKQFEWLEVPKEKSFSEIDIFQGVEYYVKIAEISKDDSPKENSHSSDEKSDTVIKIAIPNPKKPDSGYFNLEKKHKSVLISVMLLSSTCDPINRFIKIDWEGEQISENTEPEDLCVSILDKDAVDKLINFE